MSEWRQPGSSAFDGAEAWEIWLASNIDTIFVRCDYCGGSGEPYDGVPCAECGGTGSMEIEAEPITLEDLELPQSSSPKREEGGERC